MTEPIGTLRWVQQTGGRLNITAQMRLLAEVVAAQMRLILQRVAPAPAHKSIDVNAQTGGKQTTVTDCIYASRCTVSHTYSRCTF